MLMVALNREDNFSRFIRNFSFHFQSIFGFQISIFSQFSVFKSSFLVNFRFSNAILFGHQRAFIQNVILGLVRNTEGNAHVTREQLFTNVDSYYSMCYAASRGNVRSFFRFCPAGRRLNTPIAQFRLKKRTEVSINWYQLTADGVIAVLGKKMKF